MWYSSIIICYIRSKLVFMCFIVLFFLLNSNLNLRYCKKKIIRKLRGRWLKIKYKMKKSPSLKYDRFLTTRTGFFSWWVHRPCFKFIVINHAEIASLKSQIFNYYIGFGCWLQFFFFIFQIYFNKKKTHRNNIFFSLLFYFS